MFDQSFVDGVGKTNKSWTVALSFALESVGVGVLILVPLLWTEALPKAIQFSMLTAPPPPPPPAPTPPPAHTVIKRTAPRQIIGRSLQAPIAIPEHAAIFTAEQAPVQANAGVLGLEGGVDLAGIQPGAAIIIQPPAPPPVHTVTRAESPQEPAGPVRQSSGVQAARCVACPKPAYPAIAKQARIQGAVVLSAIIAKDGTVKRLAVMTSSNPLLTGAAMEAVARWVYVPTILNGEPVEVSTEITVNFSLQ